MIVLSILIKFVKKIADKKRYCELPGAALICLDFTPKDESRLGLMKVRVPTFRNTKR